MAKQKFTKRKDGRYSAYVFMGYSADGKEKRKYVYAESEKELEKKLFNLKMTIAQGTYIENENITVSQWADIWLETYKNGKEYSTYQMYESVIKNHISEELGHIKLKDLKQHHIQKLINGRAANGLTRTLEIIKLTFAQLLDKAIENEHLVKNVAKGVTLPSINKIENRSLTKEEDVYIANADLTLRERVFVYICRYAGLRRGEALALSKNDIKDGIIYVNKTVIFKGNRPEIKPHPKTEASIREVPIVDILNDVLEPYLKSVDGLLIFQPLRTIGLMSETGFTRMWQSIQKKINIAAGGDGRKAKSGEIKNVCEVGFDLTPHKLRHSYATDLYYAGVDIKQAQYLLGHADPIVTLKIYTHLRQKESAPLQKLNDYFNPKKDALPKV